MTPVAVGGESFERLRIPAYVHGYTLEPGLPQLPLKGILLDVPAGRQARLEVLDEAGRVLSGYRVYPAPVHQAGAGSQVAEVFRWDEAAYGANAFYPAVAAELSGEYVYRGQVKQRLLLYPLRFNPGTGELVHSERIRVRVEYEDAAAARGSAAERRPPRCASGAEPGNGLVAADGGGLQGEHGRGGDHPHHARRAAGGRDRGLRTSTRSTSPRSSCFILGVEQALRVVDTNGNNRLDAGDSILFYAAAVPAAYRKYARYNVYWLADAGSASPLRMATVDGTPSGGALAASHTCDGAPRAGPDLPAVGAGRGCDGPLDLLVDRDGRGVCGRRGGEGLHAVPARGAGDRGSDHPHVQPLRAGARDERVGERGRGRQRRLERDRLDRGGLRRGEPPGRGQHGVALVHGVAGQDRDGLVRGGLRAQFRGRRRTP